jgi:hypothetical protein
VTLSTTGGQTLTAIDTTSSTINGADAICVGTGPCSTVISVDKSSYTIGERVVVSAGFLPGAANDWLSIATAGSADNSYVNYTFTNGELATSRAINGITTAGSYVARAFFAGGYVKLAESPSFTVSGSTTVTTSAASYLNGQTVTVNWAGAAGNQYDWVAIAPAGAANNTYSQFKYINSQTTGSATFAVGPGNWEARLYLNYGYTQQAAPSPFTVTQLAAPGVITNASSYTRGTPIVVTWNRNAPAASNDWVAIAPVGGAPNSYVRFFYTNGQTTGSRSITSTSTLTPGTYEARYYFNGNFVLQATSPSFVIQ